MDYIYKILVPKVAIRLNITLKYLREILTDSVDFGTYMYNDNC